jgi:hypothetical protein
LLFNYRLYLKFRRAHDSFFHRTLVHYLGQGLTVFLGKIGRYTDFKYDFVENCFSIRGLSVFNAFRKRNIVSGDFAAFAKAKDINTGACPYGGKEMIKRRRS